MSNKNLFQEAIADAKAVREAALANAKAALEETMTPRLQSMIAARLEENYDELEEETYEEGMYPDETSDKPQDYYRKIGAALEEKKRKKLDKTDTFFTDETPFDVESGISNPFSKGKRNEPNTEKGSPYMEEDLDEELDLSEILAELEAESQLEEAKTKKEDEETEDEETEDEETEDEETEEEAESVEIKDMTVDEATDAIMDKLEAKIKEIIHQEMEAETPEQEEMGMDQMGPEVETSEEDIDINELLAELDEMYDNDEESMYETRKVKAKKTKEDEKEMKEALSVINTLRAELNEVNLLNAKLLYVNKIFKAKSLTESQKLQVITSFDKATTIKEAKVVFESLNTALNAPKKQLKESIGFASRAAGVAPKKQIVESNDAITRMQKLANIIK